MLAIRQHGSLAGAARALHLAAPVVTKRLAALEAALGLRLFQRTTRHVSPTAEGDSLCQHAAQLLQGFALAEAELRERRLEPAGPVRLAATFGFGRRWLGPALAAGCPVVVKGHSAHPGTGEIVAQAIDAAVKACGMPAGVFSLVQGGKRDVGEALVQHPLIKAVGFTGSLAGGRALFDLCARRPEPIPFFGELGSVNPVVLLPEALVHRAQPGDVGIGLHVVFDGHQLRPEQGGDGLLRLVAAIVGEAGAATGRGSARGSAFRPTGFAASGQEASG